MSDQPSKNYPQSRQQQSVALQSIGIIAGSRSLPLLFARQAKAMGVQRLVAVGFHSETDTGLAQLVDQMIWVRVGQLSKLISAFVDNSVRHCVMLGQVAPKNLFDLRPDLRAMRLLMRIKEKNAHSLFGAVAEELGRDGIELIEPTPWLQPLMPNTGFHLGATVTAAQQSDIEFGLRMAKEIARLEIGQTVVVKNGTVLAVEGFEGTDECLRRGGALAGRRGGAVAVKVARHRHDMRFDVPCLGLQTVETCLGAGIAVLAFEAGKTLVLDQDEIRTLIRKKDFSLGAVCPP